MTNRTGYEKMRSGEAYASPDWDLIGMQVEARAKLDDYNALRDMDARMRRLPTLLGSAGRAIVMSPVFWEYGRHIHLGDAVFVNFDCIFLDGADIRIGDGTVVAPRVQFLTAGHPVEPHDRVTRDPVTGQRNGGMTINKPITIGRDCWIGANALIMGGVTIGDGTTIGAGSVVTRDIPANVVAAGSPARIIRHLEGAAAANAA